MARTGFGDGIGSGSKTSTAELAPDCCVDCRVTRTRSCGWLAIAIWPWAVGLGDCASDGDEASIGRAEAVVFSCCPLARSGDGARGVGVLSTDASSE
jgi:hypothetical protein